MTMHPNNKKRNKKQEDTDRQLRIWEGKATDKDRAYIERKKNQYKTVPVSKTLQVLRDAFFRNSGKSSKK